MTFALLGGGLTLGLLGSLGSVLPLGAGRLLGPLVLALGGVRAAHRLEEEVSLQTLDGLLDGLVAGLVQLEFEVPCDLVVGVLAVAVLDHERDGLALDGLFEGQLHVLAVDHESHHHGGEVDDAVEELQPLVQGFHLLVGALLLHQAGDVLAVELLQLVVLGGVGSRHLHDLERGLGDEVLDFLGEVLGLLVGGLLALLLGGGVDGRGGLGVGGVGGGGFGVVENLHDRIS